MASPPRSKIPGPRSSTGGLPRIRTSVGGRSTPSRARVGTPLSNSTTQNTNSNNNNNTQGTPSRRLPPMADALPLARVASSNNGEEGIQVAIRMRPLNDREGELRRVWKVLPKSASVTQTTADGQPLSDKIMGRTFFKYDKTFPEKTSTKEVYDSVARGIVSSVVSGVNGTIFAYGQTSSGKTFTMQGSGTIAEGSAGNGGGVVHMAANDIFQHIQQAADRIFLVRVSFLEIYNEEVRDLLDPSSNKALSIREDPQRGVFVPSKEEIVTDMESLLQILFRGDKARAFAATGMNERSSRSHTIFRVTIESREKQSENQEDEEEDDESIFAEDGGKKNDAVLISTLNLVDLAGSESVRHTGATGDRLKEGAMINQSLLTLSRVIGALGSATRTHINFRDSKLTRILQPSLSGNARMAVVCCATPSELYLEETRSTLMFAARAKLVKTNAKVNEVMDDRSLIRKLQKELAEARQKSGGTMDREQLEALEQQAAYADTAAKMAEEKLKRLQSSLLNSGVLFSKKNVNADADVRKRRRYSDSHEVKVMSPPTKSKINAKMPKTLTPGRRKPKYARTDDFPTKTADESEMFRLALSNKIDKVKELSEKNNENSRELRLKEDEFAKIKAELVKERDEALKKCQDVEQKVSQLEVAVASKDGELEDTQKLLEQEKSVSAALEAQKEAMVTSLEETSSMLDREIKDRKDLETALDDLQTNLGQTNSLHAALQTEFDSLKQERDNLTNDFAQLQVEKEQIGKSEHECKEQLQAILAQVNQLESDQRKLHEEMNATSTKLQNTEAALNAANETISTLTKEKQECEDEYEELEDKYTCVSDEKDMLASEKTGLETQLEAASSQINEAKNEITSLKDKYASNDKELCESLDTIKTLQTELVEKENSLERIAADQVESKSQHDAHVAQLSQEKNNLAADLQKSIEECNALESKIDCMSDEKEALTKDLEEKSATEEGLREEIAAHISTFESLTTKCESLESDMETLVAEKNDVISELSATKEKLCTLEDTHARLMGTNSELVSSLDTVRSDLATSNENVTLLLQEKKQLEENVSETTRQLETFQSDLGTSRGEASLLQDAIKKANNLLAQVSQERDLLSSQLKETQNNLEQSIKAKTVVEGQRNDIETEKTAMQQELSGQIASITSERDALFVTIDQLKTDLDYGRQELSSATANFERQTEEFHATAASIETLHASLSSMKDQNSSLQQQLEATRSKLTNARNQNEVNAQSLQSYEAEVQAFTKERDDHHQEMAQAQVRLAEMEEQIARFCDANSDMSAVLTKLRSDYAASQEKCCSLEEEITMLSEEALLLESNLVLASEETASLAKRHVRLEDDFLREQTISANLQEEIAELQKATSEDSEAKNIELAALSRELENAIQTLDDTEKDAKSKLESVETKLSDFQATSAQSIEALTNERDILLEETTRLTEQHRSIEGELAQSYNDLNQLKEETSTITEQMKDQVASLNQNCEMLSREKSALSERVAILTQSSEAQVTELSKSVTALSSEKEALENELAQVQDKARVLEAEKVRIASDVQMTHASLSLVTEQLATSEKKESDARQELESVLAELESTKKDAEEFKSRLEDSQASKSKLEAELESKAAIAEQNDAISINLELLREELQKLEKEKTSLQTNYETLLKEASDDKEATAKGIAALQSERDFLCSDLETARNKAQTLQDQLKEANEEIESLQSKLEESQSQNSDFSSTLSEQREKIYTMENKIDDLTEKVTSANEKSNHLESEIARVSTELTEKKSECVDRADELLSLHEQFLAASDTLVETKKKLSTTEASLAAIEEQLANSLEDFEKEKSDLVTQVAVLEERIKQAGNPSAELQELRSTCDALRLQLSDMETRMGQEQRALIADAESSMKELREDKARLESDAFAARQLISELQDERTDNMETVSSLEAKMQSLESEIATLTRVNRRLKSEKESEVAQASADLRRLRCELQDMSRNTHHAEDQRNQMVEELEWTKQELIRKSQENESLAQAVNESNASEIEAENKRLKNQLAQMSKQEELVKTLEEKVTSLSQQIGTKDERIKKLEKSKLTKEKVNQWKQLQSDYSSNKRMLSEAKSTIESLKAQLKSQGSLMRQSSGSISVDQTELTNLKFNNEALEKKLKKYVVHTSALEEANARVRNMLKTNEQDLSVPVAALVDRVTSLEREVSSSYSNSSSEKILKENEGLKEELSRSKALVSQYQEDSRRALDSLQKENQSLTATCADAERTVQDHEKKVRYLEKENLKLMTDLKDCRKNLTSTKSDLAALRERELDDQVNASFASSVRGTKAKSTSMPLGTRTTRNQKKQKEMTTSKNSSYSVDKENTGNGFVPNEGANNDVAKETTRRSRRRRAPGLGESFEPDNENSQECQQS